MFKDARAFYFADLISFNKDNPLELFDAINDIVSTAPLELPVFSNENYSSFLLFFVDEVRDIRVNIIPSSTRLDHTVLRCFSSVCVQNHSDLVGTMKTCQARKCFTNIYV